MPRRPPLDFEWAAPLVRALPSSLGQRPDQGLSPNLLVNSSGEAEPRLTSGGEAGLMESNFKLGLICRG